MLKIAEAVRDIVNDSEVASEAMELGILNLSAYAHTIKDQVSEIAKKPVKNGSIVAALARLVSSGKMETLVPKVELLDLTVKTPVTEFVFEKTRTVLNGLKEYYGNTKLGTGDFFAVTVGTEEINIIFSERERDQVLLAFDHSKPKIIINNLVGVSIRFDAKYISEPNVIYALIRKLAAKRVNIIEVVSTYTELTIIIDRKDLEKAMGILN